MQASRTLAKKYAANFPAEAGRRLEDLPRGAVAAFLADLTPETAVGVVENMLPLTAAAVFEAMAEERLSTILEHLPVARCVLVMRSIDKDRRAVMMSLLPRTTASKVERLVRSAEDSAGVLVQPISVVLTPDMKIEDAQNAVEKTTGPYVYVVDADFRLLGVMHRRDLASSEQRARVENLMSRQVVRLPSAAPRSAVEGHEAWLDYDVLPVVDGSGVLIGVIRHKDIRRSGRASRVALATKRGAALSTFLDLGEVYWSGLTSVFSVMAGRNTLDSTAEGNNDA